jgi:hypothetical protein
MCGGACPHRTTVRFYKGKQVLNKKYSSLSKGAACLLQRRDLQLLVDRGGRADEVVEEDRHAHLPCMRA